MKVIEGMQEKYWNIKYGNFNIPKMMIQFKEKPYLEDEKIDQDIEMLFN